MTDPEAGPPQRARLRRRDLHKADKGIIDLRDQSARSFAIAPPPPPPPPMAQSGRSVEASPAVTTDNRHDGNINHRQDNLTLDNPALDDSALGNLAPSNSAPGSYEPLNYEQGSRLSASEPPLGMPGKRLFGQRREGSEQSRPGSGANAEASGSARRPATKPAAPSTGTVSTPVAAAAERAGVSRRANAKWPGTLTAIRRQVGHQNRVFFRSPLMALFTLVLPVSLLALLRVIYSDANIAVRFDPTGPVTFARFYVPALAAFTAAQATYSSLGVNLATQRDRGSLKRVRVTPLPPWIYLTGAVISAMLIAAIGAVIMVVAGVVFYDLDLDYSRMGPTALSFALGVVTFAALGMALASIIPGGSAAHAVANATLLPVAFISDVFIPLVRPPQWLDTLGDLLPLKPFSESLQLGFASTDRGPTGLIPVPPTIEFSKWAVMAAWLVIALVVAKWRFRWNERDTA